MVKKYTYLQMFTDDLQKQISLSEFEEYFNTPHQTVKSHLQYFVDKRILEETKKKRFRFYRLNLDNPLTREHMIICEKERLFEFLERDTLFDRLFEGLSEFFNDSKILVFGSSIVQENYSDIDILAISTDKSLKEFIKRFEQTYQKKIHLVMVAENDLSDTIKAEIRKKHIFLNAHDYFFDLLIR